MTALTRIVAGLLFFITTGIVSADPAADWRHIESLDAGPKRKPSSREEAQLLARNHFLIHRHALQEFLKKYPGDPRSPQARIRMAEIIATEGVMDGKPQAVREALGILKAVESSPSATGDVKADAGFRRASLLMQTAPGGPERGYKTIVDAAQEFVQKYPSDLRGPRLLVEAAGVCDAEPSLKRSLLMEAQGATSETALKRRIADDLTRLNLLGKPLAFTMPDLRDGEIDIATLRGRPVVLIFWSSEAPQSLLWLRDFRASWETLPKAKFSVVTISLDEDRSSAKSRAAAFDAPWPVGFEAGGWLGTTVRRLGINALPAVWILDKDGKLRSTGATNTWRAWIDRLSSK